MTVAGRSLGAAALFAAALSFIPPVQPSGGADAHPPFREARLPNTGFDPVPFIAASSTLAVWDGAAWREWWTDASAPTRWDAPDPAVSRVVAWSAAQPGLDAGSVRFAGTGRASRFNVVLLRVDPLQVRLQLGARRTPGGRVLSWSTDDMPEDAAFAVNAGMFDSSGPWGWLVLDGAERQRPGVGPLSSAVVVDTSGAVRIVAAPGIADVRASGTVHWAVQSYPTALVNGVVPFQLRAGGTSVDREHRDTRLAIGTLADGRILIALTRFDGLGDALGVIPLGPTLPEMTAVLGALGARDAVFLDGGLSAQLAVRHADGRVEAWEGMRGVPLYLAGRAWPGRGAAR